MVFGRTEQRPFRQRPEHVRPRCGCEALRFGADWLAKSGRNVPEGADSEGYQDIQLGGTEVVKGPDQLCGHGCMDLPRTVPPLSESRHGSGRRHAITASPMVPF